MDEKPDEIRSPQAVALRALAVFAVAGLSNGAPRPGVLNWLSDNNLWNALTPSEAGFIDTPEPSRKLKIDASWLSERLVVLVWALGLIAKLPKADEQCDMGEFQNTLPPFAAVSVEDFVVKSTLRPKAELLALADEILGLHRHARNAKMQGTPPTKPVDLEIIQERHHAINWITGYDGLEWDDVTRDT
jgi:hypothetical protein